MKRVRELYQVSCLAAALALVGCSKAPDTPASRSSSANESKQAAATKAGAVNADTAIAWQKGDVDAAFTLAKTANKPLFLYWGAKWCPPCNQVMATIFNRQDFIDRSRFFVPVYIDGDSPSAQRLGSRFKVSGYPTMILFSPEGTEITRLPGEVDADQYMRVLAMGMNGARPVKETLAAALAPGSESKLAPEDWRMLAYYSWITDDATLVAKDKLPDTLAQIAKACPSDQVGTAARLNLQALAAAATVKDAKPRDDRDAVKQVREALGNATLSRENFDLLTYYVAEIAGYITLPQTTRRERLTSLWDDRLERFADDATLSTADRLGATTARIQLARLEGGKTAPVPDALKAKVREQVARADRETTDAYARQAVISAAAEALTEAGLIDESDALLKAELKRSHSPYYFMLGLAANAKKREDGKTALEWYEKAYAAADGPATRLQWGVSYVNALIDLAPNDAPRIEKAAAGVIGELDPKPDTFYDRNHRGLERLGKKLAAWNKENVHAESVQRIRAQMAQVCAQLPAQDQSRTTCEGALSPASAGKELG